MQAAVFAEFAVCGEAGVGVGKGGEAEGRPVVFAQVGGFGFFAEKGELVEGFGVLWSIIVNGCCGW